MERTYPHPRIVVSRCIEFDPCRYDGSKIPSPTVARLRPLADCIPVCPELEIGLGIPRATVRIVRMDGIDHLIQPATGKDVTGEMSAFAMKFLDSLPPIDGFILKRRVSHLRNRRDPGVPVCGKVHGDRKDSRLFCPGGA